MGKFFGDRETELSHGYFLSVSQISEVHRAGMVFGSQTETHPV
jgi:hypothetical protein